MAEQSVKLKLTSPVLKYGDYQDVGKTFELPEKEAAALVGQGVAEYTGAKPKNEEAQSIEKRQSTRTTQRNARRKGASAAGKSTRDIHPELQEDEAASSEE